MVLWPICSVINFQLCAVSTENIGYRRPWSLYDICIIVRSLVYRIHSFVICIRTNGRAYATLSVVSVCRLNTECIVAKRQRCVLEQKLLLTAYIDGLSE